MLPYLIGLGIGAFIGGGIGKAIAATEISDTAQEINDMAIAGVKNANEVLKNYQDIMTEQLTELGKTKRRIMKEDIMVVGDFMSKLKKNCKLNNNSEGIRELEKLGVSDTALVKIKNDAEHTLEVFEGRELPTVGTGSVLASSFGGGALLGLGIGTMTMVAAPLLYFYGSSKLDEAEAALYKAQEHLDEAAVYVEKVKNQCSLFQAVALRANQTDCLLEEIDRNHLNMRVSLLKELAEEKGYDFKKYSDGKRKFVFKTWQVAQAVKIIIDTSLIKEDWNLNPDMEKLLEEGQKLC